MRLSIGQLCAHQVSNIEDMSCMPQYMHHSFVFQSKRQKPLKDDYMANVLKEDLCKPSLKPYFTKALKLINTKMKNHCFVIQNMVADEFHHLNQKQIHKSTLQMVAGQVC